MTTNEVQNPSAPAAAPVVPRVRNSARACRALSLLLLSASLMGAPSLLTDVLTERAIIYVIGVMCATLFWALSDIVDGVANPPQG